MLTQSRRRLRPGSAGLREHCRRRLDDEAVPDEIELRAALGQVLTRALWGLEPSA